MHKKIAWSSVILTAITAASTASALPAPMFEPELTEKSDVVVDVVSTDIVCTGATEEASSFESTLSAQKTYKGTIEPSFKFNGILYKVPANCGAPPPPINKGWAGKLHLVKVEGGLYTLTNYNGYEENKDLSKPEPLPACSASGGAGGSGGSGQGGEAGAAGSGEAGKAGEGGAAGSGEGGSGPAGAAGSPTAGSGPAGSAGSGPAGSGGSPAAAGSGSGGATAGSGTSGQAGAAAGPGAGQAGAPPAPPGDDEDGCAVSTPGNAPAGAGLLGLALGAALASRRRR